MERVRYAIESNCPIGEGVYELLLRGDTSPFTAPGQFAALALEGFFLRRPISVCDWEEDRLTLVYKIQGKGTAALAEYAPGASLDVLAGLGNGYDMSKSGHAPLLAGGGVGTPPLYGLCRRLVAEGKRPAAALGFNRARDVILADRFAALGVPVYLATVDGSAGAKGFVTDVMARAEAYSYVYACGPEPMLRSVWEKSETGGQFSFEERMGCGFGACMGCSRETVSGSKRICRDGPVLEKEEIAWPARR